MPEVSRRQCGRHLSKSYRVLASRHAKLHSIKMTPFLLVNQKSFHVDEPPQMNSNECVCVYSAEFQLPKNEMNVENQQYLQGYLQGLLELL